MSVEVREGEEPSPLGISSGLFMGTRIFCLRNLPGLSVASRAITEKCGKLSNALLIMSLN